MGWDLFAEESIEFLRIFQACSGTVSATGAQHSA